MSGRFVWLMFGICAIGGYAAGTNSWPAASMAVLAIAAGCPLVIERVRRADQLEWRLHHRKTRA